MYIEYSVYIGEIVLRVSNGKTKLVKNGSSNDMSHFFPSHYSVMGSPWYWMSLEDYMAKKEFSEFNMSPTHLDTKEIQEYIKDHLENINVDRKPLEFVECLGNATKTHFYHLQNMLKLSHGYLTWQYNAVNQNMDGWVRQIVCLGGAHDYPDHALRIVTPFELFVKLLILNFACNVLNRLHRNKAMKECRAWERKLKEFHNKRKGA